MLASWPVLVFGFPGALLSVGLSISGVAYRKPVFLILGALVAVPSAYYLGGQPGMWPLLVVLPSMPLLGALAVARDRFLLAWLLLIPNFAAATWLTVFTVMNMAH